MVAPIQLYTQEVWFRLFTIMVVWMAPWFDTDSYPDKERKFLLRVPKERDRWLVWVDYGPYYPTGFQLYNLGRKGFELAGALTTWYASHLLDFYNVSGTCCAGKPAAVQYEAWAIVTLLYLIFYKLTDYTYTMGTTLPGYPVDIPFPMVRLSVARKVYLIMSAVTEFLATVLAFYLMVIYWENFTGNGVMTFAAVLWLLYVLWHGFIWYLTYVYLYTYFVYGPLLETQQQKKLGGETTAIMQHDM